MIDKRFLIGVKALITNSKGEILVMRKVPRKASDRWKPFWDIPGGKIQRGGIKETLIREASEELGISNLKIGGLYDVTMANFNVKQHNEDLGLFFIVYKCKIPTSSKLKLSEEHNEYKWASPESAKELLAFMLPKDFLGKLSSEPRKARKT